MVVLLLLLAVNSMEVAIHHKVQLLRVMVDRANLVSPKAVRGPEQDM